MTPVEWRAAACLLLGLTGLALAAYDLRKVWG